MKDENLPLPLVCVIIPCHNKEATIKRSIDSIKKQTLNNLECIIVDDSSSDNSKDIVLAEIANDKRFRYEKVLFGNVALTRNYGIRLSDAPFISALDSDDWLEPTFLEQCITELERFAEIGIAYTGLQWHNHETGESKVSDWPGAYVAEKQFNYEARGNQIPTACVFRRDAWERVGGYRSRYCPDGAGSEDAAFWSQILSIGYTAKQVTTEPLFNYSMGGQVSSSTNYQEVDWLAWLPFSRDKRYPFACSVLPKRYSHPVRQYDEPELSIVIPVGPGHEDELRTALDSIEAQHFRNWEAIVIFDTGIFDHSELLAAYPYVKWGSTGEIGKGAGYARNRGAEMARGKFLLFLDADDFLNPAEPNSLGEMLQEFWETGHGIYSAHIGRAIVSAEYAKFAEKEQRLMAWNEGLGQAYIFNPGIEFDCAKAFLEPGDNPDEIYIWNLISTLIPRQWHFDIDGFDENMKTWEDWDYWLRMAKAGRCFTRIQKPFIIYNYISGNRREIGRQIWAEVLQYLKDKHNKVGIMGCGCGKKKKAGEQVTEAEGYIMAKYIWPNTGRHDVGWGLGRHLGGGAETFLVPEDVVKQNPHKFEAVPQIVADPVPQPQAMPEPVPLAPPQAVLIDPPLELDALKPSVQRILVENDLLEKGSVNAVGYDGLIAIKGIGPATATQILKLAE